MLKLRFPASEIDYWAARFDPWWYEDQLVNEIAPRAQAAGFLNKPDFLVLAEWKTPRPRKKFQKNPEDYIQAVTHTALTTPSERLRIEVLTLLDGVSWPVASAILHFVHPEPYPILDFRTMWSLRVDWETLIYSFDFWWDYTTFCRQTAQKYGVSLRVFDKALWQYSKENQG
ncbi:MAG: hypothetical protein K8J31_17585 [Anaerolineae bacterium]|nr:hypothetical protein [Anaerolineae bacterium]